MTKEWVYVQRIKGWVREHNPLTESGLVPQSEKSAEQFSPIGACLEAKQGIGSEA